MKSIFILLLSFLGFLASGQTKTSFDLASFSPPIGWTAASKDNILSYTISDQATRQWCQISIVKSTASKGSIEQDFDSEWQELIVKNYGMAEAPQTSDPQDLKGWKIKAGAGKFTFNGASASAMLTTASGFGRCMSVVTTTNTQVYLKEIEQFLASIDLKAPETTPNLNTSAEGDANSIIGTWVATASENSNFRVKDAVMNYIQRQYSFNSNGTYTFFSKAFDPLMDQILLGKESGSYQISGTNITLTPKSSVLEGWSKKDGKDDWGKMLNSKKVSLEPCTYRFTKYYFKGIQKWSLVLQADNPTLRDGPYSSNTSFTHAWYYGLPTTNNQQIDLPAGTLESLGGSPKDQTPKSTSSDNSEILGSWGITASDQGSARVNNGVMGTIFRQYTFNTDGSYSFYVKTFDPLMDKILLGREKGTYQINGNQLIISPQSNVLEAWSKASGNQWGKLLSTQTLALEGMTYQFSKHYNGTFNEWQLILQADNVTKRDGPYSSGKGWIYIVPSAARPLIKLPED